MNMFLICSLIVNGVLVLTVLICLVFARVTRELKESAEAREHVAKSAVAEMRERSSKSRAAERLAKRHLGQNKYDIDVAAKFVGMIGRPDIDDDDRMKIDLVTRLVDAEDISKARLKFKK